MGYTSPPLHCKIKLDDKEGYPVRVVINGTLPWSVDEVDDQRSNGQDEDQANLCKKIVIMYQAKDRDW